MSEQQNNFSTLQPQFLWQHFLALTKIARPSGREGLAAQYIKDFCHLNNFDFKQDVEGNLIIYLPATNGLEKLPTIILQAHLDMVCEKAEKSEFDPEEGRIGVIEENGWLKAVETTLGADNGIGVAASLAIASDFAVQHGPVELLFTVDEEVGLTGAKNLDGSLLQGKILLNLDSEEDDILFVGCAGGHDLKITFSGQRTILPEASQVLKIKLEGLKGGHSGIDINSGRLNAIHTLARIVQQSFGDYLIAEINGGNKRNAIPREAEIILAVPSRSSEPVEERRLAVPSRSSEPVEERRLAVPENSVAMVEQRIKTIVDTLRKEYQTTENEFSVTVSFGTADKFFTADDSSRLINLLVSLPSGVIAMSQKISGLIETSTNFGVVNTIDDQVELFSLIRSCSALAMTEQVAVQKSLAKLSDCVTEDLGSYPAWQPDMDSKVLQTVRKVYAELFSESPKVTVVHAGLECGILGERINDLQMISFGPLIEGVHAPGERVNIHSVQKFWILLQKVILAFS